MPTRDHHRRAVFVAAAMFLCLQAMARADERDIRFSRLSLEDGLSQGGVNAILQDQQGFMWFATQDGLNRYDGYRFQVYRHDPDDPMSVSHNWIWDVHQDRAGTFWIATTGGLNRRARHDEGFTRFEHDGSDTTSLSHDNVRVLYEDRSGALWVGTEGGLNRFDAATRRFERFQHDPDDPGTLSDDRIRTIFEDRQGTLWVGTYGGGLNRLDRATGRFQHLRSSRDGLSDDRVRVVYEDRHDFLWVGTYEGGLNRLEPRTGNVQHFANDPGNPASLGGNRVRAIFEDDQGTLWIGTNGGLCEWRADTQDFVTYRNDPSDPASLSDNRVVSVLQDRGGVVWVGTQGGGLNRWNPRTDFFTRFKRNPAAPSTLSSDIILSLYEGADGELWVGTFEGLNRLERGRGTVTHFRHDPADAESLSDDRVMSLLVDHQGTLWVGTLEGGLNRLERGTSAFARYRNDAADPGSISSDAVTSILEDRNGMLWMGTFGGGLNRFDPSTNGFVRYRNSPDDPASLGSDRVVSLLEDHSGTLWIGTDEGGVSRFDPQTGSFRTYRHDPQDPASLSSDVVLSIEEDAQGVLWLGTQGGGLNRLDLAEEHAGRAVFRRYGPKDGLPNNTVYGVLEDEAGHLWLSTNRGLSRFDPVSGSFKNYDITNGLLSNEFNAGAHYRSPSGEMFFGGNEGFNAFHPARSRNNSHVPPLVLTSFLKFNRPVALTTPVSDVDSLELGYRDYVVSFEFSALDYTAPEKNRYAYMLEGFHEDWIELGELHRVTFTNLDPGRYTLRVKGSNNDDVWNEEGLAMALHVLPPPWRTWWAYTLYAMMVAGLVWLYARGQARKLEREAENSRQLEIQVRARTRELADRNTELQKANRQLEKASVTDVLTGLRNRRFLMTNIEHDVGLVERFHADQKRSPETPAVRPDFQFLVFDLDGFKDVNDRYGHAAGDRVLIQVRDILQAVCRKSDTIIRWGGDEFLVVGRNTDRQITGGLAERIRRAVAEHPFDVGLEETVRLSCSIGFANFPFVPVEPTLFSWEHVIAVADGALYLAKKGGRNAWVGVFSTERTVENSTEEFVKQLKLDPASLAVEGMLELRSSIPDPKVLVS